MNHSKTIMLVLIIGLCLITSCAFFPDSSSDSGDSGDASQLEAPEVWGNTPTGDTTPTWYWNNVEGAMVYRHRLNDEIRWISTPNNQYTPDESLGLGEFTLYVQAGQIINGNYTNWSESGSFTIKITGEL